MVSPGTRLGHYNVTALLGGSVRPVLRVALSVLVAMSLLVPDRVAAQTDADRAEATARGFDGSLAEGHFAVFWRTREGTVEQVRRILADAEAAFDGISRVVGVERTPTRRDPLVGLVERDTQWQSGDHRDAGAASTGGGLRRRRARH